MARNDATATTNTQAAAQQVTATTTAHTRASSGLLVLCCCALAACIKGDSCVGQHIKAQQLLGVAVVDCQFAPVDTLLV